MDGGVDRFQGVHSGSAGVTEFRLPPLAVLLGVAGLLPFIGCAMFAASSDPERGTFSLLALIMYGAVILSFLGGVHWGFVIEGAKEPSERARLSLGVVPALLGWGAALLGLAAHPILALALLVAGYVATIIVENHARQQDLVPRSYLVLRWGLTIVVVALLAAVMVLRMTGSGVDL